MSVRGFDNEEAAKALGRSTWELIREVGRYVDISTLDGVTIAIDYDEALRELDRGVEGLRPEERTNDEGLVGVGKSIVVKRGDAVKTHLVFAAGPVCCLALEEHEPEDFRVALAIIAHECAHVAEHADRERQFPGILLDQTPASYIRLYEQQFSQAFWCEYAVCRASARFARNEEQRFRNNLAVRLQDARIKARDAIRSYRTHGDVERVFQEVGVVVLEPLRMASYLFGHLDGMAEEELPEVALEVPKEDAVFVSAITTLVSHLRSLWENRGSWASHDDMLVLGQTAFELLRECGVHARPEPDGRAYINVPFTPDTLPGASAADLLAALWQGRRR